MKPKKSRKLQLHIVVSLVISTFCLQAFGQTDVREFKIKRIGDACEVRYRCLQGVAYDLYPRFIWDEQCAAGAIPSFSEMPCSEWVLLWGKILQVLDRGILLESYQLDDVYREREPDLIFIKNITEHWTLVDGDFLTCFAVKAGTISYKNALGVERTVRAYDYGTKPTSSQIAELDLAAKKKGEAFDKAMSSQASAARAVVEAKKASASAKVLKFHQDLAAKGDAYGEYQMGLRFLNGDGVGKDLGKAREMFIKAAAQGHQSAKDQLLKLPSK